MKKNFSNVSDKEIFQFYEQISKNVKYFRKKRGLSQLQIALEIGIHSVAFYSNCENNKQGKHFNLEHLKKISKVLGVDIKDLL